MTRQHILLNKTILEIKIAEDREAVLFKTDDGEIVAKCDADCCSSTWVESITLPVNGFPAKVVAAIDIDMPDLGNQDGHDVMDYYGFKIFTDKGEIIIDYRNDSNGYYGGSLAWAGDEHYGGVYGQNISKEVWVDVKDGAL